MSLLVALIFCGFFVILDAQVCLNPGEIKYGTSGYKMQVSGKRDVPKEIPQGHNLVMKGISYFGFETEFYAAHGLFEGHPLDFYFELLAKLTFTEYQLSPFSNSFNAIRVPFSLEMIEDNPQKVIVHCTTNPTLCKLDALTLLEVFIDK